MKVRNALHSLPTGLQIHHTAEKNDIDMKTSNTRLSINRKII